MNEYISSIFIHSSNSSYIFSMNLSNMAHQLRMFLSLLFYLAQNMQDVLLEKDVAIIVTCVFCYHLSEIIP